MENNDNAKENKPSGDINQDNKINQNDKAPGNKSAPLQNENKQGETLTEEELENEKKLHQAQTERD